MTYNLRESGSLRIKDDWFCVWYQYTNTSLETHGLCSHSISCTCLQRFCTGGIPNYNRSQSDTLFTGELSHLDQAEEDAGSYREISQITLMLKEAAHRIYHFSSRPCAGNHRVQESKWNNAALDISGWKNAVDICVIPPTGLTNETIVAVSLWMSKSFFLGHAVLQRNIMVNQNSRFSLPLYL